MKILDIDQKALARELRRLVEATRDLDTIAGSVIRWIEDSLPGDEIHEYTNGPYRLNDDTKEFWVDEAPYHLRPQEFRVLAYLMKNKGIVLSSINIMDHCWDKAVAYNAIQTIIAQLRSSLGDRKIVENVHGLGYIVRARE